MGWADALYLQLFIITQFNVRIFFPSPMSTIIVAIIIFIHSFSTQVFLNRTTNEQHCYLAMSA